MIKVNNNGVTVTLDESSKNLIYYNDTAADIAVTARTYNFGKAYEIDKKALNTWTKRHVMTICILGALKENGIDPDLFSYDIGNKSVISITGFTGMYVYFNISVLKGIRVNKVTINHDIVKNLQKAKLDYKKMSEQINELDNYAKRASELYKEAIKTYKVEG